MASKPIIQILIQEIDNGFTVQTAVPGSQPTVIAYTASTALNDTFTAVAASLAAAKTANTPAS